MRYIFLFLFLSCGNQPKIEYTQNHPSVLITCVHCDDSLVRGEKQGVRLDMLDFIVHCDSSITIMSMGSGKTYHDSCNVDTLSRFSDGLAPVFTAVPLPTDVEGNLPIPKCYDSILLTICTYPSSEEWFKYEVPCPPADTTAPVIVIWKEGKTKVKYPQESSGNETGSATPITKLKQSDTVVWREYWKKK